MGGPNSQQAHGVVLTSMRRNDVASTSFRRHVPTRFFFINQNQIITFLIFKSENIENSRIELKGIVLQYLQIKLKLHLLLFYPSTWYICDFFLFHIEIEGKCRWIIGGGEGKGYVGTLSNYWGAWPPTSSYAYVVQPQNNKSCHSARPATCLSHRQSFVWSLALTVTDLE